MSSYIPPAENEDSERIALENEVERKIKELREKRKIAKLGGGSERIEKQHKKGKLTARERIELLLDPGSFFEMGEFATHSCTDFGMKEKCYGDGVVTGHGTIDGRRVYIFSQDFTCFGGTLSVAHARKISEIMDYALESRVPIIGLNDSGGARIQEGPSHYGEIFYRNAVSSGVIPQISAIMGPCAGGAAYSPALTDFTIMVKDISYMFITGPRAIKAVTNEDVTVEKLGGAKVHNQISGVAHFIADDEKHCFQLIRKLLSFLPSSNMEEPPVINTGDDPNRMDEGIAKIIPADPKKPYNMKDIIVKIVDNSDFLEAQPYFAQNIITGFARLDGKTIGIIANQPLVLAGCLDINASDKAARFIRFCDAFNIPIVTFADCPAYLPGVNQEHGGIIRHGAKMLYAYAEATVPKVTLVVKKIYGGALSGMCVSKDIGKDLTLALPTAEIAVMGPEAAVDVLYKKEIAAAKKRDKLRLEKIAEYRNKFANPYVAAERGYIDSIIEPREIRPVLIKALRSLAGKHKERPARKHGNIPL